jgi:hypothetical protein
MDAARPGDTSSSGSINLSIYQTNVLIGGQPNAFIVRTDNIDGNTSYLAFRMDARTLWHFLGTGNTQLVQSNSISWMPGGLGGALVEVNHLQKYVVTDRLGSTRSFSIARPPDPKIALATMISQDTLQILGLSVGQTTLALERAGSTAADTMTVLIEAVNSLPPSVSWPFPSWLPLWQLTQSSSDEAMFLRDTSYSFKCIADSAECTDELSYLVTNRYVGTEGVSALNTTLPCDRFRMRITVTETISYGNSIQKRVIFSGPSTDVTIDTWLAKGVGFVKALANGDSRSPIVYESGERDSSGILNGYYFSPRVAYAVIMLTPTIHRQYFFVDDTPLGVSARSFGIFLEQKNF